MADTRYHLQTGQHQSLWLREGSVLLVLQGGLILRTPSQSLSGSLWYHTQRLAPEEPWTACQTGMHDITAQQESRWMLSPAPPGLCQRVVGWMRRTAQALMKRARNAPTASAGSGSQTR